MLLIKRFSVVFLALTAIPAFAQSKKTDAEVLARFFELEFEQRSEGPLPAKRTFWNLHRDEYKGIIFEIGARKLVAAVPTFLRYIGSKHLPGAFNVPMIAALAEMNSQANADLIENTIVDGYRAADADRRKFRFHFGVNDDLPRALGVYGSAKSGKLILEMMVKGSETFPEMNLRPHDTFLRAIHTIVAKDRKGDNHTLVPYFEAVFAKYEQMGPVDPGIYANIQMIGDVAVSFLELCQRDTVRAKVGAECDRISRKYMPGIRQALQKESDRALAAMAEDPHVSRWQVSDPMELRDRILRLEVVIEIKGVQEYLSRLESLNEDLGRGASVSDEELKKILGADSSTRTATGQSRAGQSK